MLFRLSWCGLFLGTAPNVCWRCQKAEAQAFSDIPCADEEGVKENAAAADKRREETGPFRLDGAGGYLFFDADEAATEKKKQKASGITPAKGGKKK